MFKVTVEGERDGKRIMVCESISVETLRYNPEILLRVVDICIELMKVYGPSDKSEFIDIPFVP